MKQIISKVAAAAIILLAAGCGGTIPEITYSDEPVARVELNGKWGYIDTKGNEVVPCKYDEANMFSEGLAVVKLADRYMYVDKTGKVIFKLDSKAYGADEFSEGLAYIHSKGGFIDKTGKMVISLTDKDGESIYSLARAFHNGRAAVQKKDDWGFIDTTGAEIIPCKYLEVADFADGRALVVTSENSSDGYGNRYSYKKETVIDLNGNTVIKTNMKNVGEFSPEGWALFKSFTLSGRIEEVYFIDREGNTLGLKSRQSYPFGTYSEWADANPFSEGLASVQVFNEKAFGRLGTGEYRWGFIDKTGKMVIPPVFFDAGEFHEGLAAVQQVEIYTEKDGYYSHTDTRGGKWGFIDKSGKTVIPFKYEATTIHAWDSYFMDGIALVKRDGKYGYVDKSGNEVIPCKYEFAKAFSDGFAHARNNDNKWGIIDKTGREIIPCEFEHDKIKQFSNGFCAVCRNGKWGFVDTDGNEAIPCKYDVVDDFKQ